MCVCVCVCVHTGISNVAFHMKLLSISVTAFWNVTLHTLLVCTVFPQTVESSHSDYQFCEIFNCYDSATLLKHDISGLHSGGTYFVSRPEHHLS